MQKTDVTCCPRCGLQTQLSNKFGNNATGWQQCHCTEQLLVVIQHVQTIVQDPFPLRTDAVKIADIACTAVQKPEKDNPVLFIHTLLPSGSFHSLTASTHSQSLAHSPTHSLARSLTSSLPHPPFHSPVLSLTQSDLLRLAHTYTHLFTHLLAHSLSYSGTYSPAHPLAMSMRLAIALLLS